MARLAKHNVLLEGGASGKRWVIAVALQMQEHRSIKATVSKGTDPIICSLHEVTTQSDSVNRSEANSKRTMHVHIQRAPRKSIRTCYIPDASAFFWQLPVSRALACSRMGDMANLAVEWAKCPPPAKAAASAAVKAASAAAKAAAKVAKAEAAAAAAAKVAKEGLHVEWDPPAIAEHACASSVSSAASARDQRSRSPRAYRITITTKPNGETKTEMTMVERN